MTTIAFRARERSHAPKLQLVPMRRGAPVALRPQEAPAPSGRSPVFRLVENPTWVDARRILVAGHDAAARSAVLDELSRTMPPDTVFEEAGAFSEVLQRASASRMVVLSGDLDDVPAESLMHQLAHRHPSLAVVSLSAPALIDA
jgi:hypothetical protein